MTRTSSRSVPRVGRAARRALPADVRAAQHRYLQCALVLQHPELAEALGAALAERTRHLQPTVVLSPALGGIVIGQEVARALGVRALFAERQDGALTLRRGFTLSDAGSRAGRRGRDDDRRLDARDRRGGGGRRRAGRRRRRDRRSRRGSGAARRAAAGAGPARRADLRTRGLPALRSRAAGDEAGLESSAVRRSRATCDADACTSTGTFDSTCTCTLLTCALLKLTPPYDGTDYVGWQRQAERASRFRGCSRRRWRRSRARR